MAHSSSVVRYALVWLSLLVLTFVTYAVSRVDLGRGSLWVAMAVATVKATLVALFFMHLWEQRGTSRLVVAVALVFVALLIGFTVADVATRAPAVRPMDLTRPGLSG